MVIKAKEKSDLQVSKIVAEKATLLLTAMILLLLCLWGVLELAAAEKVYDHTVASIKNVELDIKALAAALSEVHLPTFSHAHELLAALNTGDHQFQVKESDNDVSHLEDLQDFDVLGWPGRNKQTTENISG